MNLCPNLNNKQVKKEFDELISNFGEDAAYYIWDLTNGEGLLNDTFKDFMAISNDREYSLLASAIEAKSIGDETFMKAPNGEQSNLDKIQWIQVRTPQFKEWFGDWENNPDNASKVVDENGEPLVVYHGSSNKFSIFDKNSKQRSSLTKILNKGFYFSNEHIAEQYSSSKEIQDFFKLQELRDCEYSLLEIAEEFGANIYDDESIDKIVEYIYSLENKALDFKENLYAVFLNIRNPIKYDLKGNVISRLSKEQRAAINSSEGAILYNVNETLSRYRGEIKVAGMYVGTDYIVFNPNQIKSADGNDGQFS